MYVSTVDPACCRTGHLILVCSHPQAPESSVHYNRWENVPLITECKTNTEDVMKEKKREKLECCECSALVMGELVDGHF